MNKYYVLEVQDNFQAARLTEQIQSQCFHIDKVTDDYGFVKVTTHRGLISHFYFSRQYSSIALNLGAYETDVIPNSANLLYGVDPDR